MPGGSSGQLQFNNAGALGGMSGSNWIDASRTLTLAGAVMGINTTGTTSGGFPVQLTVAADTNANWMGRFAAYTSSGYSNNILFTSTRGSGPDVQAAMQSGDQLLELRTLASDGTNFVTCGRIRFDVNGTVSSGIVPTGFLIDTMDSTGLFQDRLFISVGGQTQLITNDTRNNLLSRTLAMKHLTNLTAAVGIGAGLEFQMSTPGSGVLTGGAIDNVLEYSATGNEQFHTSFLTRKGASLTEQMRIDPFGKVTVANGGTYAIATSWAALNYQIQIHGYYNEDSSLGCTSWGNNTNGPSVGFSKSRGNTIGTNAAVQTGDSLGSISFSANDGSNWQDSGIIICAVDGTVATNSVPTRLVFTTNSGAANAVERMRIDKNGLIGINTTPSTLLNLAHDASLVDSMLIETYTSGSPPLIRLFNHRGSKGAKTASTTGDSLGIINFNGADGTFEITGASITANSDGTITSGGMPGRLAFWTTAAGQSSPGERMRLLHTGALVHSIETTPARADVDGSDMIYEMVGTNAPWGFTQYTYGNQAGSMGIQMAKTRGATPGTQAAVVASDRLLHIQMDASDGTQFTQCGSYIIRVDGTVATNIVPTRHDWETMDTGGSVATRLTLTNNGSLCVGSNTSTAPLYWDNNNWYLVVGGTGSFTNTSLQVAGATGGSSSAAFGRWGANANGPSLFLYKSRGASPPTHAITAQDDVLGSVEYWGDDGTNFYQSAKISACIDANAPATGHVPGRLSFFCNNYTTVTSEVMRLTSNGSLYVGGPSTSTQWVFDNNTGYMYISGFGNVYNSTVQVVGTNSTYSEVDIGRFTAGSGNVAPRLMLNFSAASLPGSHGAATSGNYLGEIGFRGDDGTSYVIDGARISAVVDGSVTTGNIPGRFIFQTSGATGGLVERLRLDSTGNVVTGGSAALTTYGSSTFTPVFQTVGTGTGVGHASACFAGATANGPNWVNARSRGSTIGSYTALTSGDAIGSYRFDGADGTQFVSAIQITGAVDGAVSTNTMPGRLVIYTNAGGGGLTERLRLDSSGRLGLSVTPSHFIDVTAGTASIAPIHLASGTNLTTAAAGCVEYDGVAFYATSVASSRQAVNAEQVQVLSAARTFTNNTSAQAIFNATANGTVTLAASTTYEFEMMVTATGFSSSAHTINLGFAGTATLTSIAYYYNAQTSSTAATPTAALSGFVAAATATAVIASSTTTGLILYVRGTVRVNAGGTFIPQLTQVTASAAAVVQANSFFRCWPIGSGTVTNVGNWS